eukprot:TRINITY_DN90756_c0_g1_i1.p1 TRINITY_DN90756_c0_g1~~TRINITY_DN90756_c0_g1_i1.p1  ORF type:complete len:296 (-),score=67.49 TRINITY_DN90756_c0_g1_i1:572-1381(-)
MAMSIRGPAPADRRRGRRHGIVSLCAIGGSCLAVALGASRGMAFLSGSGTSAEGKSHRAEVQAASRRPFLNACALGGVGLLAPSYCKAAIPTDSDYWGTMTGAKITTEKEIAEFRANAQRLLQEAENRPLNEAAEAALVQLERIPGLLRQDYESARLVLAEPAMKIIGVRLSPDPQKPKAQGAWEKCAKSSSKCNDDWIQLQASLTDFEEWCFSRRIIVMNDQDASEVNKRPQTAEYKAGLAAGKEIAEPLASLDDARSALKAIQKTVL